MIGNVCFLLLGILTYRNLLIGDNCLIERKHKKTVWRSLHEGESRLWSTTFGLASI